jgi:hypothetical protein
MRLAAGLQQQDLLAPVLGKPVGQRSSRRPRANNDEIDRKLVHAFPIPTFLFGVRSPSGGCPFGEFTKPSADFSASTTDL